MTSASALPLDAGHRTPSQDLDTAALVDGIVREAARGYFERRRSRVDDFVARHFSLSGALAIHRQALGWDMLKVPANILLAIPNLGLKLASLGAHAAGARGLARTLGGRQLLLETAVGREIEWLIMTDLMELPYRQDGRESPRDALAEAILAAQPVEAAVLEAAAAIGRHADDPAFRAHLEETLATYTGTRAAAAEITTALMTAGAALVVADVAKDLRDGVAISRKAVESGAARRALDTLVSVSN